MNSNSNDKDNYENFVCALSFFQETIHFRPPDGEHSHNLLFFAAFLIHQIAILLLQICLSPMCPCEVNS